MSGAASRLLAALLAALDSLLGRASAGVVSSDGLASPPPPPLHEANGSEARDGSPSPAEDVGQLAAAATGVASPPSPPPHDANGAETRGAAPLHDATARIESAQARADDVDQFVAALLVRLQRALATIPGARAAARTWARSRPSSYAHNSFGNASLRRGDLILTATPGSFFEASRRLAGATFDHVVRAHMFVWRARVWRSTVPSCTSVNAGYRTSLVLALAALALS
jgi:hypothetical protein